PVSPYTTLFRSGDRLLRQFGVAATPHREAPQKRHGVLIDFSAEDFVDLLRESANGDDGRSGAGMRTGGHRGNVRGEENVEPRRGAACSGRPDVYGNRHG